MKRKIFFLATLLIFMEFFIFSVSKLGASALPSPSPTGVFVTYGWYYHNYTGTTEGAMHVNSTYTDSNGNVWSAI